jgi:hypothetical protein
MSTLDDLDPPAWGTPPPHPTSLVARCHELRRTPVAEYDAEALRMLIGQQIALPVLVPRALAVLAENPLAEGDFYPGDLLSSVIAVDREYWAAHPAQRDAAVAIARRALVNADGDLTRLMEDVAAFVGK